MSDTFAPNRDLIVSNGQSFITIGDDAPVLVSCLNPGAASMATQLEPGGKPRVFGHRAGIQAARRIAKRPDVAAHSARFSAAHATSVPTKPSAGTTR